MNETVTSQIFEKIKAYDSIILLRHKRPDGDAAGSTLGFQRLLRATFPEKDIRVINSDYADYVKFIGPEDEDVPDEFYAKSLGIVLDTATSERISNQKYKLCRELIKIDHHLVQEQYGDINWVEDFRSSLCEMIVAFYDRYRDELVMTKEAAEALFAGMVTDSLRFKTKDTHGDTMRMAGILLDQNPDTETLFAHLTLETPEETRYKAWALRNIHITENGVAWLKIGKRDMKRLALSTDQASAGIGFMDKIIGSLIWLIFIDYPDGTTRVRLRSRFTTVNQIAEKHHGGGHAQAAGSTVYSKKEMRELIAEADAALAEYKSTHEGWL